MSIAPPPEVPQHYLGGIALRLLAMLSLSLMFVLVKRIDAAGIHIVKSLFWRQAIVLPMLVGWALTRGGLAIYRTHRIGTHARRAMMGLTGMALNFGGMIFLPMAEATTINLSVPIFAVIFAALFLREPTGWQRWSAVLVGFLGVLLVLNPTTLVAQGFTTDKASGAFQDAYTRFTSGASNTIGGLNDLALFLKTTATTLGEVDTQIASRLGR